jgi:hypothetical protein
MKTAVEWLEDELLKNIITPCSFKEQKNKELKLWEQAKEMEREQIIEAFKQGVAYWNENDWKLIDIEQYYNETFKSE